MDFGKELKARIEEIEPIIRKYLPTETGPHRTVLEAMNYSVLAGGKRLRPMLIHETFQLFGGNGTVIEPFMAAIEMIHSYSLVHDDLPALDNDEYRRGRKSTHAAYGEAMGILAGDALLNYAFETAMKAFDMDAPVEWIARALRVLAEKAGIGGMIGGQVVDVESEGKEIDAETLEFIHRNKTGALMEAAMMTGAILAGANHEQITAMEQAAGKIGLAFQIRDDILDVTGTEEELGKPVGSDEKNSKVTYVSLYGMEKAEQDVQRLSDEAITLLRALPVRNEFLEELLMSLVERRA